MSPTEIQSSLWNLLEHLVENHSHCPFANDSWCYYLKRLTEQAEDPSLSLPPFRQPYLSPSEYRRAKEVFETFASLSMYGALTMGKTQNANESLHSIIWHNSPKTKYVVQKSIDISTSIAVTTYNDGDIALAAVLSSLFIPPSHSTLLHLTRRDRARNLNRERAILETQKRRRRQLSARTLTAESSRKRKEKQSKASTYKSGLFGAELEEPDASGEESDTTCDICDLRVCPIGRKRKTDDWVSCELCQSWFHCRCAKVSNKSLREDPYFCDACN